MLVVARHPQRASERIAVQHDQPLVALASLGEIALRHDEPRFELRHRLENRAEVAILRGRQEHALATVSVQRLDDHLASLLGKKRFELWNFIGHERRRNRVGKIQRVKFFVRLAKPGRIVEHERLPFVGQAQQHRGVEIGRIGGRILAHEDRVEVFDWIIGALVEKLVARIAAPRQLASPRPRHHMPAARVKVAQLEEINIMAAKLRLEHEHEGRVLIDYHLVERIHEEREFMRALFIPSRHLPLALRHREATPVLC